MKDDVECSIRLWVVAPRHARRLAARLSGASFEWCYFGTDFDRKCKVASDLASADAFNVAEELNRIARETKQPFLDWIADVGSRQRDPLNWWASKIASKSPLQSDLFLLVCYYRLFRSWLDLERHMRVRIVIVEDPWLRSLLQGDFSSVSGVGFLHSGFEVAVDAAYWLARIPLAMAYVMLHYCWQRFVVATVLSDRRTIKNGERSTSAEVLLYTWVEKSCFSSEGKLHDAYMGRLEEVLSKNGETVKRLTSLSIQPEFLSKLKPFVRDLLVSSRYITITDIVASACAFFHIAGLRKLPLLDGQSYTALFHRELLHEWGHPSFAVNHLTYFSFRRVARLNRPRLKALIYPFENQPWEKMLCLGFKSEAPDVRLIGYQHASIPTLLLCYFLGKGESSYVPLPDIIVTNGKATLGQLGAGGFPGSKLVDGGAFRFEYLFDIPERRNERRRQVGKPYRILVGFPIALAPAVHLLRDLLDVFATQALDANGISTAMFTLKCHPDLPWEMIAAEQESLPDWFSVSSAPLRDLLADADLFVYAPPTGIWREAYWSGLPVLKYEGEFLDVDSTDIPIFKDIPVASKTTLKNQINSLLTRTPGSVISRRSLEEVFSPVNEGIWIELANGSEHSENVPSDAIAIKKNSQILGGNYVGVKRGLP
jgi:hypothetical protein